jgi:molecular chaperone GrpE
MSEKDEHSEAADAGAELFRENGEMPEAGRSKQAADQETLVAELEQARAKADEHWDRLMRATAELDNVRKRAERDVTHARKYALEKFAGDLLGVRDSLEMGISSAQEEGGADQHVEGMALTLKMLVGVMEKYGIEQVDPKGEPFNPEYHEAMSMQESSDASPNTVLHVMQKGYVLNDRLLRPAMVVVARAPAGGKS